MTALEVLKPFRKCCDVVTGYESFGDEEPRRPVVCLLPPGHDGPHADWTAWIGVAQPDFEKAGASAGEPAAPTETREAKRSPSGLIIGKYAKAPGEDTVDLAAPTEPEAP